MTEWSIIVCASFALSNRLELKDHIRYHTSSRELFERAEQIRSVSYTIESFHYCSYPIVTPCGYLLSLSYNINPQNTRTLDYSSFFNCYNTLDLIKLMTITMHSTMSFIICTLIFFYFYACCCGTWVNSMWICTSAHN